MIVVEHDEDTMWAADRVVDFGPGPGVRGGKIVAHGTPKEVAASKQSVTGAYLAAGNRSRSPPRRRAGNGQSLVVRGVTHNNLTGTTPRFRWASLCASPESRGRARVRSSMT
ncbi:MAG: hypothetical protein R3B96_23235 [Pirellulaceae bacterium]